MGQKCLDDGRVTVVWGTRSVVLFIHSCHRDRDTLHFREETWQTHVRDHHHSKPISADQSVMHSSAHCDFWMNHCLDTLSQYAVANDHRNRLHSLNIRWLLSLMLERDSIILAQKYNMDQQKTLVQRDYFNPRDDELAIAPNYGFSAKVLLRFLHLKTTVPIIANGKGTDWFSGKDWWKRCEMMSAMDPGVCSKYHWHGLTRRLA